MLNPPFFSMEKKGGWACPILFFYKIIQFFLDWPKNWYRPSYGAQEYFTLFLEPSARNFFLFLDRNPKKGWCSTPPFFPSLFSKIVFSLKSAILIRIA